MTDRAVYRVSLTMAFCLLATFMVVLMTGCTEETYTTTTAPCCEDTCTHVHTCDQETGCTDGCAFENVILCFNGETIKVPLSEKKDYTSQGATVGKCKKAPPGDDDDDDSDCDPTVEVCSQGDDDDDDDSDKVCICHIPPGNPDNAHTICISENAVPAHIRNHGDYLGECQ